MRTRAADVVALAAPFEHFPCNWEWHVVAWVVTDLAGIEIGVGALVAARHATFHERTRRALVREEIALREWVVARLHMHIEATTGRAHQGQQQEGNEFSRVRHDLNWAPPR